MKEREILKQIKKGNTSAFEEWIENHSKNIERFAIQYGCPPNQAGEVTEDVFRTLHNNLHMIDEDVRLLIPLYKIAVEKVKTIRKMEPSKKSIFAFEEDQKFHEKIIVLEESVKVPFILSRFHGISTSDIATIVGFSKNEVDRKMKEAYTQLGKQIEQLEKRLAFLTKSYGRMPFLFNKDKTFQNAEEVSEKVVDEKRPLSKRVLLTWIAGIISLLALITVPVVTGNEYKLSSDEKYIEKIYERFEKEVQHKLTEAGFIREENAVLHEIPYGGDLKPELEILIGELKRQNARGVKINRKKAEEQLHAILSKLELPSEMANRLFENPLSDNKEKSEEFINDFIDSVTRLQRFFFIVLSNYEEFYEGKMVNGKIDIEKFLKEKDSYPEGLQMALDGMINQDFDLISLLEEYAPIYPKYANNRLRDALHEDVGGYVTWLQSDPIFSHLDITMPLDETVDYLLEIETTLLNSDLQSQAYDSLFRTVDYFFNNLITGSEQGRVFDQNGKVNEEYQINWRKLASIPEDLPSVTIMRKIVEEMEASNWTYSSTYSKYKDYMSAEAFTGDKRGDLHSFMIKEDQPERITVSPIDPGYQAFVEAKYEEFSKNHNLSTLENVDPLVIVGIYYLANEREDPVTIWHLLSGSHNEISLDDFVINWIKREPLPEEVEMLVVDLGRTSEGEMHQHITASYEMDNKLYEFAWFMLHPYHENLWTLTEIPGDTIINNL